MFHRVRIRHVRALDDVETFIESMGSDVVAVFDVDNTLAPQGVAPDEFVILVNEAIDRFEGLPLVSRVIALTNGPPRGVERMISRGNKPWTTRRRLGLRGRHHRIVVVGDQLLTDGLLAWRLRATFLSLVIDDQNEAPRQATMRRVGRFLAGIFFRSTQ
ncbi:MAG: hypothetical protein GY720_12380 [bacterium]|nr:hypothetical protein [bacterium]